ncbi:MAG: sigma-70 family RNA polymerase sigma factor [Rickettsiales bacterium]|jgi:RNA polymerase sigma factor (sigma-70 family)|nr:sigma-70 family RNA polymerase sigma factor [Rickettsiales bacterium]
MKNRKNERGGKGEKIAETAKSVKKLFDGGNRKNNISIVGGENNIPIANNKSNKELNSQNEPKGQDKNSLDPFVSDFSDSNCFSSDSHVSKSSLSDYSGSFDLNIHDSNPQVLDPYILHSAKQYFLKLMRTGYFLFSDLKDLEQEILLRFIEKNKRYKFDNRKSSFKNWTIILIESICSELLRRARLHHKYFSRISLNDPVNTADSEDDCSEVIDLLEDDKIDTFEECYRTIQNKKLYKVINKLPEDLKQLCRLLQSDRNIAEIAKKLNLSRWSIYDRIHKLKTIFEDEGLKD